jgi:hypothetical protein
MKFNRNPLKNSEDETYRFGLSIIHNISLPVFAELH